MFPAGAGVILTNKPTYITAMCVPRRCGGDPADDANFSGKLGGKAPPLATVPFTTRLLSNTSERENMNCELKRTSAKEVRGVLL